MRYSVGVSILSATVAGLLASTPAAAESLGGARVFDVAALSSQALADVRGTASPFAPLTPRQMAVVLDAQSRGDARVVSDLGRIQMDVWWGTVGSELIATSVRAVTP